MNGEEPRAGKVGWMSVRTGRNVHRCLQQVIDCGLATMA